MSDEDLFYDPESIYNASKDVPKLGGKMNLSEELVKLFEQGYAPCLISDDNGKWAISDCAIDGCPNWIIIELEDVRWGNSPDEAMRLFLRGLEEK